MYELVPDGFEVPAGLEHQRFRLRMLSVDDVVKDFDAICSRVDRHGVLQKPFVDTVRENLVDLGWHQTVREWVGRDWPFASVDWADRS